jgi:DNA-binding winged helix-turn-helix (wHTH) protein
MRIRFHSFVLDTGARELLREAADGPRGSARPVHLSPKAFDILQILVERRPNVVSKEALMAAVWPDKVVEEANLAIAVGEIRKALGDDSKAPEMVVTVPRRGYRFAAEAVELDGRSPVGGDTYLRWWLTWNDKTLPLRDGENLVGRHPASPVWISATSVSRTHARIVVSGGTVVIEDCGSRNGTMVDGKRITGPRPLADGDVVVLGSETIVFRQWSDEEAVGTEPVRRP